VYIPPGCAHGFQALTETADTSYRIDRRHDPSEDLTIAWNDPELEVSWPLPPGVMSVNDRDAPPLSALTERLGQIRATVGTPR
jgi:dTDP-4-dehydrorhamnose 3,5-epimerase